LFDGQRAIRGKRIVPVSERSLALDPLRLLRAYRFAAELGFEIDDAVLAQARDITFEGVAAERIGYELIRTMNCDGSYKFIAQLCETGFLHQLFPEAVDLIDYKEVMQHSLRTYEKVEALLHRPSYFSQYEPEMNAYLASNPNHPALLKLAGLFHDVAKPHTEFVNDRNEVHFYGHDSQGARIVETMARRRLRLSKADTKILRSLVEFHMRLHLLATGPELTDRAVRRFFRDLKDEYFGLMMLTFADGYATAGFTRHLEEKFARMIALKREYDAVVKIDRLVDGNDLIAAGLKPGPAFKAILGELQELQIEGKIQSKEQGLEFVKENITKWITTA
jgi:poly(A) polymerase